ncbi:MAG: hypothetical protein CMP81_20950 [Fulvimarina sp.]|nr:hypothetical protein [Fulvimarina sp.]
MITDQSTAMMATVDTRRDATGDETADDARMVQARSGSQPKGPVAAGREGAGGAGSDSPAGQPSGSDSPAAGEQIATANELASAVQGTDIFRLVVVSTHRDLGSLGGLELARRLSGAGRATVLIDLTPNGSLGARMGLPQDCSGYGDLLSGGAGLADVIYRDHYTSTHFVPSGGFELETATTAALEHLLTVLDAFAEAYDYTVVEIEALDVPELPVLLDENTAVVIAGLPHVDDRMIDVADELRQIGIEDIVFMPMLRRQGEG